MEVVDENKSHWIVTMGRWAAWIQTGNIRCCEKNDNISQRNDLYEIKATGNFTYELNYL